MILLQCIFQMSLQSARILQVYRQCLYQWVSKINLPLGLQIIGNHFDEAKILSLAHHYQQITDWHTKKPKVSGD